MPTTVQMFVARGYTPQIDKLAQDNPGMTRQELITSWATTKYGTWIETNLTSNFSISAVDNDHFGVAFTDAADASVFQSQLGGTIISDGAA